MIRAGIHKAPLRWQTAVLKSNKNSAQQQSRRFLSDSEAEAVKNARIARLQKARAQRTTSISTDSRIEFSDKQIRAMLVLAGVGALSIFTSYENQNNPKGAWSKAYKGSIIDTAATWMYDNIINVFPDIDEPYSDQVLPVWESGPFYGEIPPGMPPNPLLILDLDKTLIASTHDAKYGWRHVKRPGLKKFLEGVTSQGYYEVVIFSDNMIDPDVRAAVDPNNMCHWLGPDAGELRNNVVLKRLDVMGRPLQKIIVIDDSAESTQLCTENTLLIKPFTDVYDKNDAELLKLLVFLQALVHDGVENYPKCFEDMGAHDVSGVVTEYRMRVADAKRADLAKRNKGLGRLLRGNEDLGEKDIFDQQEESLLSKIVNTTSSGGSGNYGSSNTVPTDTKGVADMLSKAPQKSDLAGTGAGALTKKGSGSENDITERRTKLERRKGGLAFWLEDREKANQEKEMARQEAMNTQYNLELKTKADQEAAEAKKKALSVE